MSNQNALMSTDEVDLLIHAHLVESGYSHTSFSLLHESRVGLVQETSTGLTNGNKSITTNSTAIIPPGHLIRILQKGLLYLEAEARYRGDPLQPAPRLIGYPIPNTLPLPPLPKHLPPLPILAPAPAEPILPEPKVVNATTKDKGKEKEVVSSKRKVRAGSDKEEVGNDGKRLRTSSAEVKALEPPTTSTQEDTEMEPPSTEAPTVVPKIKATIIASSSKLGSTSPLVNRAPSPVVPRNIVKSVSTPIINKKKSISNTLLSSSVSIDAHKTPSISALASSTNSAPSTPALATTATFGSDPTRQSSLPAMKKGEETEGKLLVELIPAKKEETEVKEKEKEKVSVVVSMEGVRSINFDDPSVIILRGHTTPKVQPCSWNTAKTPAVLATGGGDSTCRIWDIPTSPAPSNGSISRKESLVVKDNIACKHSSAQRRADVAAVAWDPSGSLLATGSEDGIARIWTPSGDLHLVLSMHQRTIFSLKWNSLGTMLLTGSLDNSVCLWELNNGKVKQQWQTHSDSVLDVDWNDDATFASASMDKSIHLFSISRLSPIHRFKGHRDEVNVVKFSPCQTLLASCSDDHNIRIWSLKNIPGLFLSSKVLNGTENRSIDQEERGGVFVLGGHSNDVHTIAWAPWKKGEPRLIASASFDSSARLWDADKGTCLHTFNRHTDYVYSLQFSPGLGTFLATGSNDKKMCVWSVKDFKLVVEYEHAGPIYELSWHPSKSQVAICGRHEDVAVVTI